MGLCRYVRWKDRFFHYYFFKRGHLLLLLFLLKNYYRHSCLRKCCWLMMMHVIFLSVILANHATRCTECCTIIINRRRHLRIHRHRWYWHHELHRHVAANHCWVAKRGHAHRLDERLRIWWVHHRHHLHGRHPGRKHGTV